MFCFSTKVTGSIAPVPSIYPRGVIAVSVCTTGSVAVLALKSPRYDSMKLALGLGSNTESVIRF